MPDRPLIFCTSSFRTSIDQLTKRGSNGYSSCHADLCNSLKNLSFDDFYSLSTNIREMGLVRVLKVRIPNSNQSLGSSAGYRCILLCNNVANHIAFLTIYPKRGKYGKPNISTYELKVLLKEYALEFKNATMKPYSFEPL
ncbi:MAG TPA: hypothetical protein VJ111_07870 [Chitinophagaceae bacterium]|nr:hypothetical protein [Chitinophagaceae bacterium]